MWMGGTGEGLKYRPVARTVVDGDKVVCAVVPRAANEKNAKRVKMGEVSAKVPITRPLV